MNPIVVRYKHNSSFHIYY